MYSEFTQIPVQLIVNLHVNNIISYKIQWLGANAMGEYEWSEVNLNKARFEHAFSGVGGRKAAEAIEEASEERRVSGRVSPTQAERAVDFSHSDALRLPLRLVSRVFRWRSLAGAVEQQRAQEAGEARRRRREQEAVAREPVAELRLVVVHQRVVHHYHEQLAGLEHLMSRGEKQIDVRKHRTPDYTKFEVHSR